MSRDSTPLLWVGLGNPGPEHARQRHNIGFMALEAIARRHGFGPWRKRFKGEVAEGAIGGQRILALKPQTYMNASGDAVQQAAAFLKIPPENVIAFHDELDLAEAQIGAGLRWSAVKDQFGTKPVITGRDFMVASIAAPTVVDDSAPAAAPGPVEATKQKAPAAGAAAPAKAPAKKK